MRIDYVSYPFWAERKGNKQLAEIIRLSLMSCAQQQREQKLQKTRADMLEKIQLVKKLEMEAQQMEAVERVAMDRKKNMQILESLRQSKEKECRESYRKKEEDIRVLLQAAKTEFDREIGKLDAEVKKQRIEIENEYSKTLKGMTPEAVAHGEMLRASSFSLSTSPSPSPSISSSSAALQTDRQDESLSSSQLTAVSSRPMPSQEKFVHLFRKTHQTVLQKDQEISERQSLDQIALEFLDKNISLSSSLLDLLPMALEKSHPRLQILAQASRKVSSLLAQPPKPISLPLSITNSSLLLMPTLVAPSASPAPAPAPARATNTQIPTRMLQDSFYNTQLSSAESSTLSTQPQSATMPSDAATTTTTTVTQTKLHPLPDAHLLPLLGASAQATIQ